MSAKSSTEEDTRLQGGSYAKKQLFGASSLLKFSHGGRFKVARELASMYAGKRVLDYGCGDGTFLATCKGLYESAVGAEIDPHLVTTNRERFAAEKAITYEHTSSLAKRPAASFDTVFCMEVLEHCTPEVAIDAVAEMRRLVADDGVVIVSVPIEIGASLVAKQAYRAYAGYRRVNGYESYERYRTAEMLKMVFAHSQTYIERPVYEVAYVDGTPIRYCGHKGFNWRALQQHLKTLFNVRETQFSPVPLLGPLLNAQAWFICSPLAA